MIKSSIPPKGSIPRISSLSFDRFGSIRFGVNSRSMQTSQNDYKVNVYKKPNKKKKKYIKIESCGVDYLTKDVFKTEQGLEVLIEFDGIEYLTDKFVKHDNTYQIGLKDKSKLSLTTEEDILAIDIDKRFHDEILLPDVYKKDNKVSLKNGVIYIQYDNKK